MYQPDCLEQRGRCSSFKTWKQWRKERRKEVERINQSQKASTGAEAGDQADLQPEDVRRGSEDLRSEAPDTVAHGDP